MILRRSLLAAPAVLLLPRGLRAQVAQTGAGHATAFTSCNGSAVPAVPANVPSGGAWTTTDLTVVANVQNAPDFTLTASSITVTSNATALGSSAQYNIGNAGGAGPGTANPVRAKVYLRTLGVLATSWVLFQVSDGTNTFGCYFNTFTYGSVGNPVTGGDGTLACKSATLVTNGYILLDISGTFTGNHANVKAQLFPVDSNGGTTAAAGLAQNFWGFGAGSVSFTDPRSLSGLQLWVDSTDNSTFTIIGGSSVQQWNDKSGHGNHMLGSGSPSDQPVLVVNVQNSLQAVSFGVAADSSPFISQLVLASFVFNQPFTVFSAAKFAGTLGTGAALLDDTTGTSRVTIFADDSTDHFEAFGGTGAILSSNVTGNSWVPAIAIFNGAGTASSLYINTVAVVNGDLSANSFASVKLGNRYSAPGTIASLQGYIGDFGVYNRILNGTEITQLMNWMKAKWGV